MDHRCSAMLVRGLAPYRPLRGAARQARVSENRTIDGKLSLSQIRAKQNYAEAIRDVSDFAFRLTNPG